MNHNLHPEISIVVPVCHGGVFLQRFLDCMVGILQDDISFEILAVCDADDRASRGIILSAASNGVPVHVLTTESAGQTGKLNAGCLAARGTLLAFTDDDCLPRRGWLKRIRSRLDHDPEIGILGGPDTLARGAGAFDMALDYILNSPLGCGGMRGGKRLLRTGGYYPRVWNMAALKADLLAVAGHDAHGLFVFDPALSVHADVDLALRIEGKLKKKNEFDPMLSVEHHRDTNFSSFARRNFHMGRVSRRIGSHSTAHRALALFCAGLPLLALAAPWWEPTRLMFQSILGIYAVFLLVVAVGAFRKTSVLGSALWAPALAMTLHLARGLGYLRAATCPANAKMCRHHAS